MLRIELAPVVEDDIEDLLVDLLPEDEREILAMGLEPHWAVRDSVSTSIECVSVRANGQLAALFGVSQPVALGLPRPWLLGTSVMREHPVVLLCLSRKIIRRWQRSFPAMANYVDARHCVAVNWLRWLGAKLTLEPEFGPFRRPFYRFEFGDSQCV